MTKNIVGLAGAVVLVLSLSGCLETEPVAVQPAESGPARAGGGEKTTKKVPVKLTAKRARFAPGILHGGGAFTCVKVTVTNQTAKNLEVNPLYFAITDGGGTRHDTAEALGADENQIDTLTLAPKEKASGTVCAEGEFTPKVVSFTNPLFSEVARAEVG